MEPKIISYNNQPLAIFFSKKIKAEKGICFLTPENYPLQIGLLEHKNGRQVPPHKHRDLNYNVKTSQEFIYIEKGEDVVVKIFNSRWKEIDKINMSAGDFILFVSGGHSLDIPTGCRLIEVKQGPYPGDKLAKIFKK
ncbi:hypothetical protein KKC67_00905 [Patescibacteria group bacterium]|nr:hypothetical protein [Patescibacteria group bacterium]MBU0879388.1 hypothetical protein [Patescibacteria group bacterium]MBU0879979.1 hypothetical protein [Patescibacteria group bacterium]MBU0897964.1 hypothetical protein [Patescibacteria group bacterium]MBU1062625.1 hypothetical protein [Patescibacteria group bacterium]